MSDSTAGPSPFQVLDASAEMVEMWTGVKAQFVNAGWSPRAAEQMVIAVIRSTSNAETATT